MLHKVLQIGTQKSVLKNGGAVQSAVLNELKSQDRLVGFITHVDDIKQLIPHYIEVKKDITGSSTIKLNS